VNFGQISTELVSAAIDNRTFVAQVVAAATRRGGRLFNVSSKPWWVLAAPPGQI
jgi:hypothetical protein